MADITPGKILIADPFLKDPNFMRTVIFLCEHQQEGSFGFVLNKEYDQQLGDLIADLEDTNFPVYFGGPVQLDTVHFLHNCPQLIPGGYPVTDGIYWGGDFQEVVQLIKSNQLSAADIRFFIGYSGWGKGQLDEEMEEKSWITGEGTQELVFPPDVNDTWKLALQQLGGEYVQLINYPIDPQLN
ncbi:YqgE/AlgH family protein [Aridibaculum aurantiacum]|uniref:YqgE/AlgH family protein n=1 Tax=Aridibaculum aurantiacum TaxID=2810307 RepID=UPI001A972C90|nr:YqgE/AlgH family protein [Aridibaculum aurantiacum]